MDLRETLTEVAEVMKRTKTEWVATEPEDTDLGIYLHCYRDDALVVTVQCVLDRDKALAACEIAAAGFNVDVLTLTFESYHSELTESPITGKRWRPQEMQYVAQTYPEAYEKGWVNECLSTLITRRGGGHGMHSQPYLIREQEVEWGEPKSGVVSETSEDTPATGGYMYEVLQHAMAQPSIEDMIAKSKDTQPLMAMMATLVSDPEARYFHMDMATYRRLSELKLITGVMFAADVGSQREEWLTERLGPPGTVISRED